MTLKKIDNPNEIEILPVNRSTLPAGDYRDIGNDCRQVAAILSARLIGLAIFDLSSVGRGRRLSFKLGRN